VDGSALFISASLTFRFRQRKKEYAEEEKEEEERDSSDVSGKSFGLFATGELHRLADSRGDQNVDASLSLPPADRGTSG